MGGILLVVTVSNTQVPLLSTLSFLLCCSMIMTVTAIAMVSVSPSNRKLLQVSGVTTDINTVFLWLQM